MVKKFRSKKYKILHERNVRTVDPKQSEKELLEKARAMFSRMESKKEVKNFAAKMSDRVVRFDLMGTPEISFFILIENGKLKFSSKHMHAEFVFGIPKELFLKLVETKQTIGNVEFILNKISFRKGTVRECLRLRSMLLDVVFSGEPNVEKKEK